jgi:lysyl-tRNA synthetase class 2
MNSCFISRRMSMDDTNSLIEQRKAKLTSLRSKGIDPFQNKFTPDIACGVARAKFESGELAEHAPVAIAGRITAHRDMGKSQFMDLKDTAGRVQIYAQKQALGDAGFDVFKHLDMGDFIGVKGTMFRTKTGEPSVKVESFVILAKALRPPPAQWYGLEDTEIRYRQRYLDLIANDDVRSTFLKRSAIVHEIRQFFHSRGYVEVETPAIALELYHKRLLVGGIDKLFEIGKNFRNEGLSRRHNPEFTMLEAYQAFGDYETMMETVQSLICHVAQKVLGTLVIKHDRRELLNSTLLEFQKKVDQLTGDAFLAQIKEQRTFDAAAFAQDIAEIRGQVLELKEKSNQMETSDVASNAQNLVQRSIECLGIAKFGLYEEKVISETNFSALTKEIATAWRHLNSTLNSLKDPKIINLTPNWKRAKYKDLVREKAGADWFDVSPAERRQRAHDIGAEIGKEYEDFEVTGAVFEKLIEPTLIQPTFVTHLPKELVPLAKLSPDDPTTVEVFECCINGQEISPGYTEQNDPIAQRTTLEHQAGGEQQKLDDDFLVALEHGMPPAGGIGIGIDRLCMMLLGQESIRDVILFPQLKPK